MNPVQDYIYFEQAYEDMLYARRAYERLSERVWKRARRINVDAGPACVGQEREILERQLMRYILAHGGSVPDRSLVKQYRELAREHKRALPTTKQARLALVAA